MSTFLAVRSLFFAIVFPGTVTVAIPYLIVTRERSQFVVHWAAWHYVGFVPIAVGAGILISCIRDFAVIGRGTLAPIDPPKELVVQGLYRYVRNPMYLGVLTLLLGEAVFFESIGLLQFAAGWAVVIHLFVLLYEEPTLKRKFGESYDRYCRSVRRWVPRMLDSRTKRKSGKAQESPTVNNTTT